MCHALSIPKPRENAYTKYQIWWFLYYISTRGFINCGHHRPKVGWQGSHKVSRERNKSEEEYSTGRSRGACRSRRLANFFNKHGHKCWPFICVMVCLCVLVCLKPSEQHTAACIAHTHTHTPMSYIEVNPYGKMGSAQSSVIAIAQQAMGHALPL